jgi:hypothetical protein
MEGSVMRKNISLFFSFLLVFSIVFSAGSTTSAAGYDGLEGLKSFNAVVDMRSGKPKKCKKGYRES